MSGPNGQLTPGPGAKIIPLMPGVARPSGGRREELRTAVLQVITHLVIEKVPLTSDAAVRPGCRAAR
jgi:hypothetical protein